MYATLTQMFSISTYFRWAVSPEDASEMPRFVLSICGNSYIFVIVAPRLRYPYFDAVVGLVWSNDRKSYTSKSVVTGRVSQARHVKGDDPDKKGCPCPPGWGLGVRLTTPPSNTYLLRNFNQSLEIKKKQKPWSRGLKRPRPKLGCSATEEEEEDEEEEEKLSASRGGV